MELVVIFSLVGVAIAICAIIAVIVVLINADRQIIKNVYKIMMQGNRNDVIRFETTLSSKRLEVTEINKVSESYGKIAVVKNKTDEEMKKMNANLIINSVAAAPPEFANLTGDHGCMNTRVLNNTGRDIAIKFVSCCPGLVANDIENVNVNTYFVPTVIKNGAIAVFPLACRLSKASTANIFVVDLSISDTGVVLLSKNKI